MVFVLEINEDESDYACGRACGAHLARGPFLGPAVDPYAYRGRGNRTAVIRAIHLGANPAWRIVFGACQSADAGHARLVFADSEPDLRFWQLGHRGIFFVLRSAETSVGPGGDHSLADLPCEEGRAGARRQIREQIQGVQSADVVLSSHWTMPKKIDLTLW